MFGFEWDPVSKEIPREKVRYLKNDREDPVEMARLGVISVSVQEGKWEREACLE